MTIKVTELRGMTDDISAKLIASGIKDSDQFLAASRTAVLRRELAATLGGTPQMVLGLANRADLARIKGVGAARGDLLEEVGVDTVRELAQRNPASLHAKIAELHQARGGKFMPSLEDITGWIDQAKTLDHGIEH